jgi:hypothetical protein
LSGSESESESDSDDSIGGRKIVHPKKVAVKVKPALREVMIVMILQMREQPRG